MSFTELFFRRNCFRRNILVLTTYTGTLTPVQHRRLPSFQHQHYNNKNIFPQLAKHYTSSASLHHQHHESIIAACVTGVAGAGHDDTHITRSSRHAVHSLLGLQQLHRNHHNSPFIDDMKKLSRPVYREEN